MNEERIKQVTKIKNPKRVAASKKSYQERMLKMKKEILENAGSNDTNGSNDIKSDNDVSSNATNDISGNSTNNTKSNNDVSSNATNDISGNSTNNTKSNNDVSSNATNDISGNSTNNTKSDNDVYFYGIGLSILVLGVFLIYYNFDKIKPQSIEINKKSIETQPPKHIYRKML